jgi:hypothetical protein
MNFEKKEGNNFSEEKREDVFLKDKIDSCVQGKIKILNDSLPEHLQIPEYDFRQRLKYEKRLFRLTKGREEEVMNEIGREFLGDYLKKEGLSSEDEQILEELIESMTPAPEEDEEDEEKE